MRKEYYQNASDWSYDRYLGQGLWLRRSLLALFATALMLCLSLTANVILIPLKEKVPYLYAFDHATGEITKVGTLEPTSLNANWNLSRYLLMNYVRNYEGYNYDNVNLPYQQVWAQSGEHVRSVYEDRMKSTNSASPIKLYGKDKYITINIKSINKLNDNTVDIKFDKTLHDRASRSEDTIQKEAIMKWEFDQAKTSQKMLDRDPLGFKVTYYQTSQVDIKHQEEK